MVTYNEKHSYIRGSLEIGNSEERLVYCLITHKLNFTRRRWKRVSLLDYNIDIIITRQNRKYYQNLLNRELNIAEYVFVNQNQVSKSSKQDVSCECDFCKAIFIRKRIDVKTLTFCSKECRNNYMKNNNPNPKKEKIIVQCVTCKKEFGINEAKSNIQDNFFCSRECYNNYRSVYYNKEQIYNYQDLNVQCTQCGKSFKTCNFDIENRNNLFCSPECYWNHRKDNYSEVYFIGDLSIRETKPERLVREYLESNNIKYKQNCPMFRRYYVDFYLKDYRTIIEVYGDYWHSNPNIYGEGKKPLNDIQRLQKQRDIERELYIQSKNDFQFYIIWESDIYKNLEYYMGDILSRMRNNKQESATTTRYALL